jgi:hypothetical protein
MSPPPEEEPPNDAPGSDDDDRGGGGGDAPPPPPPSELERLALVAYRSAGLGTFGAAMRYAGMPLEKVALFMNSSQVPSGPGQFRRAVGLTFRDGALAPYRVVGPASLAAWFMAYSVMGASFQFFDRALGAALGVDPVWYGKEVMDPPPPPPPPPGDHDAASADASRHLRARIAAKTVLAPIMAACLESVVANRAEVQRYFGPQALSRLEASLGWNPVSRYLFAPAYGANVARNVVMCGTSFVLTPITYKLYFPQDLKSQGSLLCYGMGMNMAMNSVAITQQALWGRCLDYAAQNGGRNVDYGEVIRTSLRKEGMSAFFTVPKWFSRILMNAPVQGSLPWFYNNVLPLGDESVLKVARWVGTSTSPSVGYGAGGKSGTISCESREMQ